MPILTGVDASTGTITLSYPQHRNALDATRWREFNSALRSLIADERISSIVVTGDGDVFTAGGDIAGLLVPRTNQSDSALFDVITAALTAIVRSPVPVIVRVNGDAIGAGSGIVAAAHLAVSVDSARFGFPEVRVGLISSITGVLLQRAVSSKHANRLTLTGEVISAAEAGRIGLVNDVVPVAKLDETVAWYTQRFASLSRPIVAHMQDTLTAASDAPLDVAIQYSKAAWLIVRNMADSREGLQSFLDKRPPVWGGR
jgi:methylglutaconyl-CoA hydratase